MGLSRLRSALALALATAVLWLLPAAVWGQPTGLTVEVPVPDATGVTFRITWPGVQPFTWAAGFSDGSTFVQGGPTAPPLALRMPFHASGAAAAGWTCVGEGAGAACSPLTVPAKSAPPQVVTTHTFRANEPNTNADGTPLKDLAKLRIYWRVNGGAESFTDFPTPDLAGGKNFSMTFDVPAATGTLTAQVTALDLTGNESSRTVVVSKVIGGGTVPGPIPGTPTFTLTP